MNLLPRLLLVLLPLLLLACGQVTRCQDGICISCHGANCAPEEQPCPGGTQLVDGQCLLVCEAPTYLECDGRCVNPLVERENCGACGSSCETGLSCVDGRCREGCGGRAPDSCGDSCVDSRQNPNHCGSCDAACAASEFCVDGDCVPSCGALVPDVCGRGCFDLATDPHHCGACDNACEEGLVCAGGQCQAECPSSAVTNCESRCVDLQTDPLACGSCGQACALGESCSAGQCQAECGVGTTTCLGQCIDLGVDTRSCGVCGRRCEEGALCSLGNCGNACRGATETACGDRCVELSTDPAHCGTCEHACKSDHLCSQSECIPEAPCTAKYNPCDAPHSTCSVVDDRAHCECEPGFAPPSQDSPECLDIDECAVAQGGCGPASTCVNTTGSFECACPEGYDPDNLALFCHGTTATADSTVSGYSPDHVIDGDATTVQSGSESWANAWPVTLPQSFYITFHSSKTVGRVEIFSSDDFVVKEYAIDYWDGASWIELVYVAGNTSVHRSHSFTPVITSQLRIRGVLGPDKQFIYIRLNEVQIFAN